MHIVFFCKESRHKDNVFIATMLHLLIVLVKFIRIVNENFI